MSIFTIIIEKLGFGAISAIPSIYKIGAIVVALAGLLITARVYFDHKVDQKVAIIEAKYQKKMQHDANDLHEFNILDNQKIVLVYQDKIKVITKTLTKIVEVAKTEVPDVNTMLSNGWLNTYNASITNTNPVNPSDKTNGLDAVDVLVDIAKNNAICQDNSVELTNLQQWVKDQQAKIAAMNKANGAK